MSWKDILKRVDIDLDEADKTCCEIARGEFIQWYENYALMPYESSLIESESCDELLERINEHIKEKEQEIERWPDDSYLISWLEELEMIRDNWEDCKEGAKKVKDDLKVKPEGFNPEEPYAKYKKHPLYLMYIFFHL